MSRSGVPSHQSKVVLYRSSAARLLAESSKKPVARIENTVLPVYKEVPNEARFLTSVAKTSQGFETSRSKS
jgi:hypothetical protein